MSKLFTLLYMFFAFLRGFNIKTLPSIRGLVKKDNCSIVVCESDSKIYGLNVTGAGVLNIGHRVEIRNLYVHLGENACVTISDGVFVGDGVKIISFGSVCVGENTLIAPNVVIVDNDHVISEQHVKVSGLDVEDIKIGGGCWIGANSVVGKGAIMGDGAVLACMSYLNSIVSGNELYAGSPARKIKDIR